MTYQDSFHNGRMDRALPGLTAGVKVLLIANLVGFLFNNLLTVGVYRTFLGLSFTGLFEGYGCGLLRVVSYQFIHSLSLGHILWNMLMLYFFGTMVEGRGALGFDAGGAGHGGRYLGRTGIIKLYLGSGAVGGLLFVVVSALFGEPATPVIGASGAVYGIMMYAACIDPRRPIHLIFISVEIRYLVGFLVFVGLYSSYIGLFQSGGGDGVAHSAHLGGALWGYLAYRLGRSGRAVSETGLLAFWRHRRAAAQRRSAERSQATLDRILEKVHRDGMSDLSAAERRFLERVSKDARK